MNASMLVTLAMLSLNGVEQLALAVRIYLALMLAALAGAGILFSVWIICWTIQRMIRLAIRELRSNGLRRVS